MIRTDVHFQSGKQRCEGWLHLPSGQGPFPCIVFAHGIGAIRQVRVAAYAQRFVAAGYAVFSFDYRHWGTSEGLPRYICDIGGQQADIRAAIDCVRGLAAIDAARIALFGTSFGGGLAIAVAADRPDLAAVIAQCAVVDGLKAAALAPPVLVMRWVVAGMTDLFRAALGRTPHYIKLAGEPGELGLMTAPGAEKTYHAMIDGESPWRNTIAARFILGIPFFRPALRAHRLRSRLLMLVTDRDGICPGRAMAGVAARAPFGEAAHFDADHFDIYFGHHFERAISVMLEFLDRAMARIGRAP